MALDDLALTFRDEFDTLSLDTGTAATDANFWNTSMYNGTVRSLYGNAEEQWYVDSDYNGLGINPFSVDDGILTITARPTTAVEKSKLYGYNYVSGVLTSQGEFSQTYGYFEIRAQVPEGKGLWPAFWLLADHNKWPPELDVMEVIGDQTNYVHQTVHTDAGTNRGKATWSTEKLSAGYHTYGMDWTKDTITFYLDGKATWSMATPGDMHSSMYLLMNLAVGGSWPGSPNSDTQFPAEYNIDYVRVYQHTGVAGSGGVLPPTESDSSETELPVPLSGLSVSNEMDPSSASAQFVAPDTGANTSTTYTASQLGLSGVPSNATMTVAFDAEKDITVVNNGAWNDIKNASVVSATTKEVTLNNFVGINVSLTGGQDSVVNVSGAKRGTIATGAGNDTIGVAAFSNGTTDNLMTINAGDGANHVTFSGASNTKMAITTGAGTDQIMISGQATGTANGGAGNDLFLIRSTGAVTVAGGAGKDVFDLAANSRVTISDFRLGEDSLKFNGVADDAIDVRTSNGSTAVDVNGLTAATLTGISLTAEDLGLAAPVVVPEYDPQTSMLTSLVTPDAAFTGWPPAHTKLSNGANISVASSSSFTAAESAAGTSRTYTTSQMNLAGVESGTTVTVAYDAQKNITVTNNGAWGGIRNAAVRSGVISGMTVNNFAGVDVDMSGNQHGNIRVNGAMQGSITTGSGNDRINVSGVSNGTTGNLMTISAGNGTNTVNYTGGADNRTAIITGSGADTITISGQAKGTINAGHGNDRINVHSTGNVSVAVGWGADVVSIIAGAHATIADFNNTVDRIELVGVTASDVRVRNDGNSTVIDLNGNTAAVLSGVALKAEQINFAYA